MTMNMEAQRQRVLALLLERGPAGVTTNEISAPAVGGLEGTRRVRELREHGWPIQAAPMANGWWRYWLGESGEPTLQQPGLFD